MPVVQKILVIEDEMLVYDVISTSFSAWTGTEVQWALNGHMGVQKIRDSRYELVIIEAVLPGSTALKLAELAANQNMPVLLMTDYPNLFAGSDGHGLPILAKPFLISDLLLKAKTAIAEAEDNIRRVKASLEVMKTRTEALATALGDSKNLLIESQRLGKRSEATNIAATGFFSRPLIT